MLVKNDVLFGSAIFYKVLVPSTIYLIQMYNVTKIT